MLPKTVEAAAMRLLVDKSKHKLITLGSGSYAVAYYHADYPEYVIKISRVYGDGDSRDYFAGYYYGRYCMKNPSPILPTTYLAKRFEGSWVLVQKRYLPPNLDELSTLMHRAATEGIDTDTLLNMFPKADVKAFLATVDAWYLCDGDNSNLYGKRVQDKLGSHAEVAKAGAYVSRHVRRESLLQERIQPDLSASNIMFDSDTRGLVYVDPFCVY